MSTTPAILDTPLVSILVPSYNVARFITDCLDHIVPQMTARHELIVVDDGSTDATVANVQAVQAAHPQLRIRLHQQHNQGISDARNTALLLATGDYIVFVDSDDRLLPGSLAALEPVMTNQRPDVIATALRMWTPDAPGKDRDVFMSYPPHVTITSQEDILAPFFADRHMYVWCKIFRREIYMAMDMPLFPSRKLFEDVAVVPRLLQRCTSLIYLPHVLLAYRQHPVSITRVISEKWCVDFVSALAMVKPDFERAGVSAAVRRHFDEAVCYFYIGLVKNSYQLPSATGASVRRQVREIFLQSLFSPPQQILAGMTATPRDIRVARQVKRALDGSWLFHWEQSAVRKLKLWQRMQRTRAAARA